MKLNCSYISLPVNNFACLAVAAVLLAAPVEAANKYVRAGANGSGTDRSNAYPSLPSSLTRGDVYYIADGDYGSYTFDDAGTTLTTIKKATTSDHGTDTGWSSSYGDGVATFAGLDFTSSYWVVDGQVGGGPGSWTAGFGFQVRRTSSTPVLFVRGGGNIVIRHVQTQGAGDDGAPGGTGNDSLQVLGGSGPVTLSYAYLEGAGRCHFYHGGGSSSAVTVEFTYTGKHESTSDEHSELAVLRSSAPFIFRWSIVAHEEGTGGFIGGDNGTTTAELYGNIFYNSSKYGSWGSGNNGFIAAFSSGSAAINWKVYNNTFIGFSSDLQAFGIAGQSPSGNQARNNYFYQVSSHSVGSGWTQSYEHFQNSGSASGSNGTSGSGDPFVGVVNLDFRLKAATAGGQTLGSPYNVDMYGNVRGADGVWDRGAVEFGTGTTTLLPPAAPQSVRVVR